MSATTTAAAPLRALPFDAAALDAVASLLTLKGAEAKIGAVWPVIEAVASSIYVNGARREQFFTPAKGRERHPAFNALHDGRAPVCRAFRAMLDAHAGALTEKGRELSQEAHDNVLAAMFATFSAAATPAPAKPRAQADKDAAALARAIELVRGAAVVLSDEQVAALAAVLAARAAHVEATA